MSFTDGSGAESCIHFYTLVTGNFLLQREGEASWEAGSERSCLSQPLGKVCAVFRCK